jgi:arginyl-tRNA synthetase
MREILKELSPIFQSEMGSDFSALDWSVPPNSQMGHLAVPCFRWAKAKGCPPPKLAAELAPKLNQILKGKNWFSKALPAGPYINFFFKGAGLFELFRERAADGRLGSSSQGLGKTCVLEFSSTNVAKEIGLHHLRSTAIGHSLANIFQFHNFKTVRINYLGDWGTSFGKLILALNRFGSEKELHERGLEYMLDLYVKFVQAEKADASLGDQAKRAFKDLEAGDPEKRRIWKLFCELSIAEFKQLYDRLGIHFDYFDGESLYESKLGDIVRRISETIGTRISDGATVVDLPGHEVPALLLKDDGASLYLTRDLAAAFDREQRFHFDEMLYIVAVQQKLHFRQLFDILKGMKAPFADRCEHIPFGMLSFGSKTMKSREGNAIFLRDALDEGKERALTLIKQKNPDLPDAEKTADAVGMGALLFFDLSQNRNHDIKFNWDQALSFEGDTGPFLQYTHARTSSLNEKVSAHRATLKGTGDPAKLQALLEDEAVIKILLEWAFFETYCDKALENRDPAQIAVAALNVAKAFNQFYHKKRFLEENDPACVDALLALSNGTRATLKTSLGLMGIQAPHQM